MDKSTKEGIENLESTVSASEIPTKTEGTDEYADPIEDNDEISSAACRADMDE
jgi:hypothetical protein